MHSVAIRSFAPATSRPTRRIWAFSWVTGVLAGDRVIKDGGVQGPALPTGHRTRFGNHHREANACAGYAWNGEPTRNPPTRALPRSTDANSDIVTLFILLPPHATGKKLISPTGHQQKYEHTGSEPI